MDLLRRGKANAKRVSERFWHKSERFGHKIKWLIRPRRPDPKSPVTPHVAPEQSIAQSEPSVPDPVPEESHDKLIRNSAPLENLPAEIRRHLLSTLDYKGLKALVHASSIYHQQYLLDRHHLLCKCLETTLGGNTTGACAVYQSGLVEFSKTRTEEIITQFLESYGNSRFLPQYSFLKTLTLDQVISIVAFHLSIIKPLARYYAG